MGQEMPEMVLAQFGFCQQSNHITQSAHAVQKRSVKLLGKYNVDQSPVRLEKPIFFIGRFFVKFFPSHVGLLGGLGKFFHPVLLGYALSHTSVVIIRNVFRKKACFDIHVIIIYIAYTET